MKGSLLRVGFVHAGPHGNGVTRFGHMLADAAGRCPAIAVEQHEVDLAGGRTQVWRRLRRTAHALGRVDLVHLQYNNLQLKSVWGRSRAQVEHLWVLTSALGVPLVITLHDVPERAPWRGAANCARLKLRAAWTRTPSSEPDARSDSIALWWLHRRTAALLVCSDEEQRRVARFLPGARTSVIPHFVEPRTPLVCRAEAKAALGLSGRRVVTLLGYIHRRKGHDLLVRALPHLPADVTVVFAGGAEPHLLRYRDELTAMADALGVAGRLQVTGYLAEADLERCLAATDLAVCPFRSASASGSLATWLSVGTPLLASDLPLVAEYNDMEPGAIATFEPLTSFALAEAVRASLDDWGDAGAGARKRLRDRLALDRIVERHVEVYREVVS